MKIELWTKKRSQRKFLLRRFNNFFGEIKKKLYTLKHLFLFLIIISLVFLVIQIFKIDQKIEKVKFFGLINPEKILEIENYLLNKNFSYLNTHEFEDFIVNQTGISFEKINVIKKLGNSLYIDLVQNSPFLFVVAYNTLLVLDSDFKIIQKNVISSDFSLEEWKFRGKTIDPNIEYLKNKYFESLDEEKKKDFDWNKLLPEEKQNFRDNKQREINNKWSKLNLDLEKFKNDNLISLLPTIFYPDEFTEQLLNIETTRLSFSIDIFNILEKKKIDTKYIELLDEFGIKVISTKQYIFNSKRDKFAQLQNLQTIINSGLINQYSIFDFRSENIAVI